MAGDRDLLPDSLEKPDKEPLAIPTKAKEIYKAIVP
jgi:hypothetical protein